MSNKKRLVASIVATAAVISGCGNGNNAQKPSQSPQSEESKGPVTLKLFDGLLADQDFKELVEAPLMKQYPDITIERIPRKTTNNLVELNEMMTGGVLPDIILNSIYGEQQMRSWDIPEPLSAYAKKEGTDFSKVDPVIMDTLKETGNGDFYALPLFKNVVITFYNKDIFDKFGVPYPKDGMTFKDYMEVGRSMTRMQEDVQYLGMQFSHSIMMGHMSSNKLDPKTGKAMVVEDENFKRIFEIIKDANSIPGMVYMNNVGMRNAFFKERRLAMMFDWAANFTSQVKSTPDLNWDMVTMPVMDSSRNVHSAADFHAAYVTKLSKNKSAAYKVVSFLSTSQEVQMNVSKSGRITVLNDSAIQKEYGTNFFKGKHIEAIGKTKMNPDKQQHMLENRSEIAGKFVDEALQNVLQGTKDVNTALREAAEAIDRKVEAELKK
jgi:multiple sugar transport system substrate-binding protein